MRGKLILFFIFLGVALCEARYFNTVVIDPGHGGRDAGAYWGGVKESTLNLIIAQKLAYELKARGVKTVMTRRSDTTVSKASRAAIANRYPNSIFVSIHFNAHTNTSIKGLETFYLSSEGRKMAHEVQSRMARGLKGRNRGIKNKGFYVLRATNQPAILVECGFISNSSERARCATQWYKTTTARTIADGLMAYRKKR